MIRIVSILLVFFAITSCSKRYSGEGFVRYTYNGNVLSLQIPDKDLKKYFSIEDISEIQFYWDNEHLFSYANYGRGSYLCTRDENYLYLSFRNVNVNQLPNHIIIKYGHHSIDVYLDVSIGFYHKVEVRIRDISHHTML